MTNSSDKSVPCEVIPVSLVMPSIPLPANAVLSSEKRIDFRRLPMRGLTTATMSVNQAARVTDGLLDEYLRRVRQGKLVAVQDLLDINPMFLRVPKVHAAWVRLMGTLRAKRRRGRPKGIYTIPPAIVLGLVMVLRARRRLKTDHQAIRTLVRLGILTYSQARNLYRAARKDPGLLPLLLPRREERQILSAEEFEQKLASAITPQPGQTVTYVLKEDGVLRLVKVTDGEAEGNCEPA